MGGVLAGISGRSAASYAKTRIPPTVLRRPTVGRRPSVRHRHVPRAAFSPLVRSVLLVAERVSVACIDGRVSRRIGSQVFSVSIGRHSIDNIPCGLIRCASVSIVWKQLVLVDRARREKGRHEGAGQKSARKERKIRSVGHQRLHAVETRTKMAGTSREGSGRGCEFGFIRYSFGQGLRACLESTRTATWSRPCHPSMFCPNRRIQLILPNHCYRPCASGPYGIKS
jgi:hypothetical protein